MGIISNAIKANIKSTVVKKATHTMFPGSGLIPGNDPISKGINLVSIGFPIVLTGAFATVSPKFALRFFTQYAFLMILVAIYSKAKGLPIWTYKQ